MSDQEQIMIVSSEELLARYIFFKKHIRPDSTIRPDAFIPYPYPDLSVTRHFGLTDEELWGIGNDIAEIREKTLYGRGDLQAAIVERQKLQVLADPLPENRNHANITNWPPEKSLQKIVAQELSIAAGNARKPPT